MKGLCTVACGEVVTLNIRGGDLPNVGEEYYLEPAKSGSQEQNRLFHSLVLEFFKSGMHSYDVRSFEDLKNCIKKSLGVGFDSYVYVDVVFTDGGEYCENTYHHKMFDAKTLNDIPDKIKSDPYMKDMIRGKLKSWSKYSKKERTSTIDNLITEMIEAGVHSKKFEEILNGIGDK